MYGPPRVEVRLQQGSSSRAYDSKIFVMWLSEIRIQDAALVGGKAAHLGELMYMGAPVPVGFCATVGAFRRFLEVTDLAKAIPAFQQLSRQTDVARLRSEAQKARDLIREASIPDEVARPILGAYHLLGKRRCEREVPIAVRSSATLEDMPSISFAGQLMSFLSVKGDQMLLEAVKNCWAALFGDRVILYARRQAAEVRGISMGVVVQEMVPADKAGVLFTVDPATGDQNSLVIESCLGLGKAVVEGLVVPDIYRIDKQTLREIEVNVGHKHIMFTLQADGQAGIVQSPVPKELRDEPSLSKREARAIAKIGIDVERYYAHPQDIEWAYSMGKLYVLQTRPITGIRPDLKQG